MRGYLNLLQSRLMADTRKTVVFDTFWSKGVVKKLKLGGHRTILIMESFKPDDMLEALLFAERYFDHVFFPCQAEEIRFHYQHHSELWALLKHEKFEPVDPFVRAVEKTDESEKVIFTLGGGGDHDNEDPKYTVRGYLEQYVEAARILRDAGKSSLYIAKGPLLTEKIDLHPLQPLETMRLPDHFGVNTTVITRGTYNLTWEAIAAGAKLVTCGVRTTSMELADGRNRYLAEQGYAYCANVDGRALADAVLLDPPARLPEGIRLINARPGLARICDVLCGE
jgi:hypothetical protein